MSSENGKIFGTIHNVVKDKPFGFIKTEDGATVFFHFSAFKSDIKLCMSGSRVLFRPTTNAKGAAADEIEVIEAQQPVTAGTNGAPAGRKSEDSSDVHAKMDHSAELLRIMRDKHVDPGQKISKWSRIVFDDINIYKSGDGDHEGGAGSLDHVIPSQIPALADMSLPETWCFNYDKDRHSILKNYMRYTFFRLAMEGKIAYSEQHAAFNTGLVDNLYEPIYGLFKKRRDAVLSGRDRRPYDFVDWCVVGKGASGKLLMKDFPVRPEAATYFTQIGDVIFDDKLALTTQWDHVLDDGISRGRFPKSFLQANSPRDFSWDDSLEARVNLEEYVKALQIDSQRRRQIKNRLDDAIQLAKKRASWNYKTAIPSYYPRRNKMSILLPLALTDDNVVDLALVVEKANVSEYYGATVYPLDMAYKGARLVCRPDSDWLRPDIDEGSDMLDEDDGD